MDQQKACTMIASVNNVLYIIFSFKSLNFCLMTRKMKKKKNNSTNLQHAQKGKSYQILQWASSFKTQKEEVPFIYPQANKFMTETRRFQNQLTKNLVPREHDHQNCLLRPKVVKSLLYYKRSSEQTSSGLAYLR